MTTDFMEELRRMPARSATLGRLLAVLGDPNADTAAIASALQLDPSLSVRVLQLANSAYFGGRTVTNLERAVVTLGTSVIRPVVVIAASTSMQDALMPPGFFEHSVAVAAGASLVARRFGQSPGDALCAGLLHDLGAALLFRWDTEACRERTARGAGDDVLVQERAAYGRDHAGFGAFALETWNLPASIVNAVAHHHTVPAELDDGLSVCVLVGEALARLSASAGAVFAHEPTIGADAAAALIDLPGSALEDLVRRTDEDAENLGQMLNLTA